MWERRRGGPQPTPPTGNRQAAYRDALGAGHEGHGAARGFWDSAMVGAALPENTSAAGGGEGGGARWRGAARERRVPPISIFCCCCCCGAYKYLKPRM